MSSLNDLAPYAVMGGGLALGALAGWAPLALPEPVTWAGLLVGFLVVIAGAIWADRRRRPDAIKTDHVVQLLAIVGLLLGFGALGDYGLGGSVRLALALGAIGIYAVVGYWTYFRRLPAAVDERQQRIRYRAIYNGFVVLCGLLLAVMVLVFALGTPGIEHYGATSTLVGLGAFGLFASGILVVLVSEGWYRTRM